MAVNNTIAMVKLRLGLMASCIFILVSCSPENRKMSAMPAKSAVPEVTKRPTSSAPEPTPSNLSNPKQNSSEKPVSPKSGPSSQQTKPSPSKTRPVPTKPPIAEKVAPKISPEKSLPLEKQVQPPPGGSPLPVKATVYFTPSFKIKNRYCQIRDLKKVIDSKHKPLGELCPKDYDSCLMEGACHIETEDGFVTVNYSGRDRYNRTIFFVVDTSRCPAGMGVQSACLDPFYTVAADLRIHRPGEVIYISEVRGLPLPDGSRHSGYFIVRDTGAHRYISGRGRFDFFTDNVSPFNKTFQILKYFRGEKGYNMHFVSVGIISPALAALVKKNRNFPLTPQSPM